MDAGRGALQIGDWRVEPALDSIARDEVVVKLEPRAMRVLVVLAERPGDVCSAEFLLDRVWPGVVVTQTSVYQVIAALRRALGDTGDVPRYIATVPRKGYRLIAPVSRVDVPNGAAGSTTVAAGHAPAMQPAAPGPGPSPERVAARDAQASAPAPAPAPAPRRVARIALVAGVLAIAFAGAAAWLAMRPPPAPRTVAVEPIADLSDDGSGRAFALGLTQELVGALGGASGFEVVAPSADATDPAPRAQYVLGGSVRLHEGRARVTLQLVDTRTRAQVWANSFDRARAQPVAVQADVARTVAAALGRQLDGDAPPSADVSAYDYYLLGRRQQLLRQADSVDRALHYYGRALAVDPEFALAHAGLGEAQLLTYWYAGAPFEGAAATAENSVRRALELDPELAEGYAARGLLRIMQWRIDEAIADLQRAIAINPNLGEAYQRLGIAYDYATRPQEALAAYDELLALDPLHTNGHLRRGLILKELGRYEDAERAFLRAYELQPELPNPLWARALVRHAQGDVAGAVTLYRQAIARAPHRTDLHRELALLYLDLGDLESARAAVAAAQAQARPRDPEFAAAQAFVDAAARGSAVLRVRTAGWRELEATSDQTRRVELAALALAAGEPAAAAGLLPKDRESALRNTYSLAWSVCEPCAAAGVIRATGTPEQAERAARAAAEWLAALRRAGYRMHGIDYAEALLAAADGRGAASLDALERAHANGWRRAWLVALEPAFAGVAREPRFRSLLARVERDAAAARSSLRTAE